MEAHCVNLELKYQNQALKEGQHGQFLKVTSNEAKDRSLQTKTQNDSLMEQLNKKSNENADVLAQIQKKGFAIAALKNELRKLTGNSVNTKFAKPSILGKPVGQPLKNQSVVRQPTAFKSERPRLSKPQFASQVDVNNDLSKPVTTHHLPKGRESAPAKPHHMIAPNSLERHLPLAQQRYSLKYRYIVQSYRRRTQSLVAKKKDISENRASRNFDLMITRWCLLKITLQAPFFNVQMASAENNTSGPNSRPQQRTVKFKAGSKSCSSSSQDSYITTRVGITIPPSYSNAKDNRFFKTYFNHKVAGRNQSMIHQELEEDLPTIQGYPKFSYSSTLYDWSMDIGYGNSADLRLSLHWETITTSTARVKLVPLVKNEGNILSSYYCLCSVSAADTKVNVAEKIATAVKG
ncbi:hypothetical protein Tco_0562000 [Tanacetum coccineum]